jgi:NAD(P)-dependent dehydrogenase (short-subunit alcohol dehydrogenase family)
MSLQDKNVVVTGGSRGLGSGLVETLVDLGAKVTVVARQSEALEAVRNQLGVERLPPMSGTVPPPIAFSPRCGRTS